MTNILKMKISSQSRSVKVTHIEVIKVELDKGKRISEKVAITAVDQNGKEFKISDTWLDQNKNGRAIKGLWLTTFVSKAGKQEISNASALAQVMNYYNVKTLEDLIGKKIVLHPDSEGYLVIVACDIEADEVNIS